MRNIERTVYAALAITWMIVIFCFSAEPADVSSEKSMGIGYIVADVFVRDFDRWETERQQEFVQDIEFPIRKAGHATEFAVLGFLYAGAVSSFFTGRKRRKKAALAWGLATLYAATDEIHQLFVPGRSCQATDVLLDSAGVLAGVGIYFAVGIIFNRLFPRTRFCDTLLEDDTNGGNEG